MSTGPPTFFGNKSRPSTADVAATITTNLDPHQQELVNLNRQNLYTNYTKLSHNRRINLFINFVEEHAAQDPNFIGDGSIDDVVVGIDMAVVPDKSWYMYSKVKDVIMYRTKDLIWKNITVEMVNLFYAVDKYNCKYEKGQLKRNEAGMKIMLAFDTRRKYFDALTYGKSLAQQSFNSKLEIEKPMIIKSLRIANAKQKGNGQVEEKEADPMSRTLCEFMCKSAIFAGNSLWWTMGLLQWNCMARSQNIDNLRLTNLKIAADDSIVIKFTQTKKDKEGKKTSPKHCYANPLKFHFCLFTSLAIHFCVLNNTWTRKKEYLFINQGSQEGTASSCYCETIRKWACYQKETILQFIRPDHCNAHGIRKGSATEATGNNSETALASVFHRGEWSLGVVLDIYWKFAQRGDQLLGRYLAGLDPESPQFDILPPHFIYRMDNELVQKAMQLCFANILSDMEATGDSYTPAVLYRCLPSLIYHEQAIRSEIAKRFDHPWRALAIFQDLQLLEELKQIVTTDPTPEICATPTGAARNTKILRAIDKMTIAFDEEKKAREIEKQALRNMATDLKQAVKEGFEEKALENGHLTFNNLSAILDSKLKVVVQDSRDNLSQAMDDLKRSIQVEDGNIRREEGNNNVVQSESTSTFKTYSHGKRRVYFVPHHYDLPKNTSLSCAFRLFVNGDRGNQEMLNNKVVSLPVRPFYFWDANMIPTLLWRKYKSGWLKILKMMMATSDLDGLKTLIEKQEGPIPNTEVMDYYNKALVFVHSQVEYIKNVNNWEKWCVTTWNRNINYHKIQQRGTEADIERLPPETRHNKKHTVK